MSPIWLNLPIQLVRTLQAASHPSGLFPTGTACPALPAYRLPLGLLCLSRGAACLHCLPGQRWCLYCMSEHITQAYTVCRNAHACFAACAVSTGCLQHCLCGETCACRHLHPASCCFPSWLASTCVASTSLHSAICTRPASGPSSQDIVRHSSQLCSSAGALGYNMGVPVQGMSPMAPASPMHMPSAMSPMHIPAHMQVSCCWGRVVQTS